MMKKFIILLLLLILTIGSYYFGSQKEIDNCFLNSVSYDVALLELLEDNRSIDAKKIISSSIDRVFVLASKAKNIEKYFPVCPEIIRYNTIYGKTNQKNISEVETGKKKLTEMCKLQKTSKD